MLRRASIALLYSLITPGTKNMSALFDICQKLPINSYELIIAGYGYLYSFLVKKAYTEHKFDKKEIQFYHAPTAQMIHDLYAWADLFLFVSQTDTQGLVIAE